MRQKLGGLKTLKGHCPAVLPVQGETGENGQRSKNTQQGAVRNAMKSTHQWRASGDLSCREGALDQL